MRTVPETLEKWMAFVDAEVQAACEEKGWGRQVRRKWSARERPVAESPVDDYEWKLKPDAGGVDAPIEAPETDEGRYYVLGVDTGARTFTLKHANFHGGDAGKHRWVSTGTTFPFEAVPYGDELREFLLYLVERFRVNDFSLT